MTIALEAVARCDVGIENFQAAARARSRPYCSISFARGGLSVLLSRAQEEDAKHEEWQWRRDFNSGGRSPLGNGKGGWSLRQRGFGMSVAYRARF